MISAKKYHQEIHASYVWYWYRYKPITKPLYTSNIQHDPQFTIGIKGNKMCFPIEIHIHLTSLVTRDSSSSEQYFVAQWHYDEVNEWMLPQILSNNSLFRAFSMDVCLGGSRFQVPFTLECCL